MLGSSQQPLNSLSSDRELLGRPDERDGLSVNRHVGIGRFLQNLSGPSPLSYRPPFESDERTLRAPSEVSDVNHLEKLIVLE